MVHFITNLDAARIDYRVYDGFIGTVSYYVDGKYHNPFGPAIIVYSDRLGGIKGRVIVREEYLVGGRQHNNSGYAIKDLISYNKHISISVGFCFNGVNITREKFFDRLAKLAL